MPFDKHRMVIDASRLYIDALGMSDRGLSCYIRLYSYYWCRAGSVRFDEQELCRICGYPSVRRFRNSFAELIRGGFFEVRHGFLVSDRIDEEIAKCRKRDPWLPGISEAVLAKTGGSCFYCDTPLTHNGVSPTQFTIDHGIPFSKGGTDDIENLYPACRSCNSRKGTMSTEDFMALMQGEAQ